jgi:hypothetical protein
MTAIAPPGATGTPPRQRPLLRLAGIGLGISAGWFATSSLPPVYAAVLTSLLLAGGASLAGGQNLSLQHFWLLIGAAVGGVLGTAQTLTEKAHALSPAAHLQMRLLTVAMLALAGSVAGFCLGRDAQRSDRRHPRDLLRSASALTTGLFALLVTLTFLHQGLEGARSFSSRLSTTLTIIVTSVVVPGWLSQQWRARAGSLPPLAGGRR